MNKENKRKNFDKHSVRTAILVDGGFYRKRAKALWGNKSSAERADELNDYCYRHLKDNYENRYLYRVFYYDCPPIAKNIYNPVTQKTVSLVLFEHIDGIRTPSMKAAHLHKEV